MENRPPRMLSNHYDLLSCHSSQKITTFVTNTSYIRLMLDPSKNPSNATLEKTRAKEHVEHTLDLAARKSDSGLESRMSFGSSRSKLNPAVESVFP